MTVYIVTKESCWCGEPTKDIVGVCSTEEKALELIRKTNCSMRDSMDYEEYEVDAQTR